MKYPFLAAVLALFIFACGGVEVSSEPGSEDSSPSTETSSSSNENSTCTGANCCNGASFDPAKSFCYTENDEEQLYPLCDNKKYNPYEQGCFDGHLYPKCELPATRGTCVYSSLLRCRQEGSDNNYIIDPLPGMTCQPNGAITGTIRDLRENPMRTYKTVQINNQIWLAENLNYDPTGLLEYSNSMCHNNDPASCDAYGRLYDWATMLGLPASCNSTSNGCTPQGSGLRGGLCPETFGIPKTEDWQALANYAGGNEIAGGRLKSQTGWANNGYGTDNYNFTALPGGYAQYHGNVIYGGNETFIDIGKSSFWWVDTQKESEAHYWRIITQDTEADNHFQSKGFYLGYVRCVKYGN